MGNLSDHNPTRVAAEAALTNLRDTQPATFLMLLLQLLSVPQASYHAREFAAVILRQNLLVNSSSKAWSSCSPDTLKQVQAGLLHLFTTERVGSLRRKITDAVAATATRVSGAMPLDMSTNEFGVTKAVAAAKAGKVFEEVPIEKRAVWDELMPTVAQLAAADAPETRQSILELLERLAQFNPNMLHPSTRLLKETQEKAPHRLASLVSFLPMVKSVILRGLQDAEMATRLAALRACISVLVSLGEEDRKHMQDSVPYLFQVLGTAFQAEDDETLVTAVSILTDLATVSPKFLKSHLKPVLDAMSQMVASQQLEPETRRVCMSFLLTLAEEGRGMVRKLSEFAAQVIPLAFGLVQELQHTAEWDDPLFMGSDDDGQENYLFGLQSIQRLSEALGGKIFMPIISPILAGALQHKDWNVRHAALVTIAHMALGVLKELEPRLKSIVENYIVPFALNDPNHRVRWAALEAMAFLADSYEPMFANVYTDQCFTVMQACLAENQHWRLNLQSCNVFTDFAVGLETEKIQAYLPTFLTALVRLLTMRHNPKVMTGALKAVAIAAAVAEKGFIPYYAHFMPGVKQIITTCTAENERALRAQAIETMGIMAEAVGVETFRPEVAPVIEALLQLLPTLSGADPEHESVVEAMARIGKIVGRPFKVYLPHIIPGLLTSAAITNACVIINEGDVNPYADKPGYHTQTVEMRQIGTQHISSNTSLLEEKSRAIRMLSEYVNAMGGDFFPYAKQTAEVVVPGMRYQFDGASLSTVRQHSVMSLPPLIRCGNEALAHDPAARAQYALNLVNYMFPFMLDAIEVETRLEGLNRILGEFAEVIEHMPEGALLTRAQCDLINVLVRRLIIECLARCQKRDELANSDECDEAEQERIDEDNAEEDTFLGYVYALINRVVKNVPMIYTESFHEHLWPIFTAMISAKCDDASLVTTGLCVVGQVMEDAPSHPLCAHYVEAMHAACMKSLDTSDFGLLQSATFGFGTIAMVAKESYAGSAVEVMEKLAGLINESKAEEAKAMAAAARKGQKYQAPEPEEGEASIAMALDNAIGALAKIFIFTFGQGANGKPLPQSVAAIMSAWVHYLPCEDDQIEARKIHDLLANFVQANNPYILGEGARNLPIILGIIAAIFARDDWEEVCSKETKNKFITIFTNMQKQMPQAQLNALFGHMNAEQRGAFGPYIIQTAGTM